MKNQTKIFNLLFKIGICVLTVFILSNLFIPIETKAAEISFTANGNDTEDDTQAIQAALDAAREAGGGTIVVPAGKYYISKTLTIYSNTTLKLDKDAEMIRMADAGQHIMIRSEKPEESSNVGGYEQFSNITITGGTWNGNVQDKTVLAPLMYFCHGNQLNLKDFDIKSACSKHMIIIAGASDSVISNVNFSGFVLYEGEKGSDAYKEYYAPEEGSDEVNVELSKRTMEALHLDIISADGASESMAYPCDGTVNKNITVENCTFTGMMSGIGNHFSTDSDIQSTGLVIHNNTFTDMEYTAINLYNQSDVTVTGNEATNTGELVRAVNSSGVIFDNEIVCSNSTSQVNLCGIKATNCSDFDIKGNTISGGVHGISLDKVTGEISDNTISASGGTNSASTGEDTEAESAVGNGITIFNNSNVDVKKNRVEDSVNNGIYADNAIGTISENEISKTGNFGIALYNVSNKVAVTDNVVTNSKKDGILLNNVVAEVTDNTIQDVVRHGIYALEKSSIDIKGNKITTITENGIYLNNAVGSVSENVISGIGNNGIYIFDSKNTDNQKTIISNNEVTQSTGHAIRVEESNDVTINSNTVSNSGKQGIHLYNALNTEVKDCTVTVSGAESGIYVYGGSAISVDSCILNKNVGNGIAVYNTTSTVLNANTINDAANGILLNNAKGKATSNKITAPTERGIWMLNSTDAEVNMNTITEAKSHGIHVNASTGTLNRNTIQKSGGRGILVYGSINSNDDKLVIKNHTIENSKEQGIHVDGSSTYVSVSWNVITDNTKQGISVVGTSSDIQVENNKITKNGQHGIYVDNSTNVSIKNNFVTENEAKVEITALNNTTGNATDNVVDKKGTYTYSADAFPIRCTNGLVKAYTDWKYVTNGVYDTTYTGLAKNLYGWWYIKAGTIDTTYTGMAKNQYGWWYVKNGKLDTSYTGMAKNQYGWWYMKKGKLDTSYTGMAKNPYGWWYMKNGKLDTSYTGMAKNQYGWWYIKNGKLDTSYTGMAKNQYGWWYMKNGKLDITYTGLATNSYGTWYMKKGKLDTSYSGKVTHNGKVYTVKNGKAV